MQEHLTQPWSEALVETATGVEPVGAALAVAGLIAAFKGAVDGYLLIESFFDDDDGSGYLSLRYHIEKHKLVVWGDFFNTSNPSKSTLAKQPEVVKRLLVRILGEISKTHKEAKPFLKKHDLTLPSLPTGDVDQNLAADSAMAKDVAKLSLSRKSHGRINWIIKRKDKFSDLVARLQQLNRDLYDVLQPTDVDLLQKTLASYVLSKIEGTAYIKMLQDPQVQSPQLLALSAKLMNIKQSASGAINKSLVSIHQGDLTFKDGNRSVGVYTDPSGQTHSVWIEWRVVDPALPSYKTFRAMAESLTVMLQAANEPALRTPPCCGIYDDLLFESVHGKKRLGTVFKVRKDEDWEENLRRFPPISLKDLLRSTRGEPPLLGDRFKLAYQLASAFTLFHAAGWLHKGFRSENIMFLTRKGAKGVLITEPFITGFQASRTQDTESVKQRPELDAEVEYYYHVDSADGFNKRLYLYSLGVVLCEVGRWELLADAIKPAEKKANLKSRPWATRFICGDPLKEMGWRMGERYRDVVKALLARDLPEDDDDFFAHEYFTTIIMPLEQCTA